MLMEASATRSRIIIVSNRLCAPGFGDFTALVNKQVYTKEHPEVLRPLMPEIEAFAKHNHFNVLHPILR